MTIRFKGYVQSLAVGFKDRISVSIGVEALRSVEPITVQADASEVGIYRPGMEVEIAITPTGTKS